LSKAEAVAVWYGSIVSTQQLNSTGDLKMRWERGLCLGNLNEDRAEDGIGFVDLNAATAARPTPERKTDLAADIESSRFSLE
jgi:hypothetical protein